MKTNSYQKLLWLLTATTLCSSALAGDYVFENTSKNKVKLTFAYSGVVPNNGILSREIESGGKFTFGWPDGMPRVRVDLSGGTWENSKGVSMGNGFGDSPAGTYKIK